MHDESPAWLTKCQSEQAKVLLEIGLEFINSDDLFEEINFDGSEKVEDWEFITHFPENPKNDGDYPNGNDYVIYARCNDANFSLYFESQAVDFKAAKNEFDEILKDFKTAKASIESISKRYSAHCKQLCLV